MKIYSSILMQRIETRVDNNGYQNRESYIPANSHALGVSLTPAG